MNLFCVFCSLQDFVVCMPTANNIVSLLSFTDVWWDGPKVKLYLTPPPPSVTLLDYV